MYLDQSLHILIRSIPFFLEGKVNRWRLKLCYNGSVCLECRHFVGSIWSCVCCSCSPQLHWYKSLARSPYPTCSMHRKGGGMMPSPWQVAVQLPPGQGAQQIMAGIDHWLYITLWMIGDSLDRVWWFIQKSQCFHDATVDESPDCWSIPWKPPSLIIIVWVLKHMTHS